MWNGHSASRTSLRLFNFHRALRLFHVKHCGFEPSLSLSSKIQFAPQTSLRLDFSEVGSRRSETLTELNREH